MNKQRLATRFWCWVLGHNYAHLRCIHCGHTEV